MSSRTEPNSPSSSRKAVVEKIAAPSNWVAILAARKLRHVPLALPCRPGIKLHTFFSALPPCITTSAALAALDGLALSRFMFDDNIPKVDVCVLDQYASVPVSR